MGALGSGRGCTGVERGLGWGCLKVGCTAVNLLQQGVVSTTCKMLHCAAAEASAYKETHP